MGNGTKIEWTDATWNPVSGCDPVSEGCRNCYARQIAERFRGTKAYPNGFGVTCHEDELAKIETWKKKRGMVFVGSMGDLFHGEVPFEFVWRIVQRFFYDRLRDNTFLFLTKRPKRMRDFMVQVADDMEECRRNHQMSLAWPPRNLWLGVSVEDQKTADERIPVLLQIPAALRFVSCEPLLGPMDLRPWVYNREREVLLSMGGPMSLNYEQAKSVTPRGLDWVIAGGETGRGARPMHPDWVRGLRDQCVEAGVPFFFKSWGEWKRWEPGDSGKILYVSGRDGMAGSEPGYVDGSPRSDTHPMARVGKKLSGHLLDGQEWHQFPEVSHG